MFCGEFYHVKHPVFLVIPSPWAPWAPWAACFLLLLLAWNSLAGTGRSFTAALTPGAPRDVCETHRTSGADGISYGEKYGFSNVMYLVMYV